jgi:excisionase family DNA binding protein
MSGDTRELAVLDAIPMERIPAAIARLAARAMEAPAAPEPADGLLTPDEVATLLRADRRFVYRHAKAIGGVRLSRRKLRFSAARVRRYIEGRR